MCPSRRARHQIQLSIAFVIAAFVPSAVRGEEVRLLYEVTQGTYVEEGGFVGVWGYHLPASDLAFLELTIDTDSNTATLQRYGANLEPIDGLLFDIPDFEPLTNLPILGPYIVIAQEMSHPFVLYLSGTLNLDVTFDDASILLSARASFPWECCDIPYLFAYNGVDGVAIPTDFGDADLDHKTDLADLGAIVECLGGPGVEIDSACDFADGDGDVQVDLADVALMQRTWNPSAPR
jgi:hypothetical protein